MMSKKVPNSKKRKPYTITKPRENWTSEEHQQFLDALELYERDWKKIEGCIKTKTVIQIRSHAQKYFIKMQKQGNVDCIPPPRPKRRTHNTTANGFRRKKACDDQVGRHKTSHHTHHPAQPSHRAHHTAKLSVPANHENNPHRQYTDTHSLPIRRQRA